MLHNIKDIYHFDLRIINLAEEIRKLIFSIDPNIKEVFRKYYISYKRNKCFVYLWFCKNNLWVYLKIDKSFKDKLNQCKPTPKGVNVTFDKRINVNKSNIKYVFYLIKKSYELVCR
jgi:predicted transport protein